MSKFWEWILGPLGLSASQDEKLDKAAEKMQEELTVRKDLAARHVALARARQRELAQAVARHENLMRAAVKLRRQGEEEAVHSIAVELSESQARIDTLTSEVEELNKTAADAVENFRHEQQEVQGLLRQHGQVKAAARMNEELSRLQDEMQDLAGASTARGAYRSLVSDVEVAAEEHRAFAELESGGEAHRAKVNRALKEAGAQEMLELIESEAQKALPEHPEFSIRVTEKARQALDFDPIRQLTAGTMPEPDSEQAADQEEAQEDEE